MSDNTENSPRAGERIAKVIARAGLCSRREAETWIAAGRVAVNGKVLSTPACVVGPDDRIAVDGRPLPQEERTRLWLYHKPKGLVTTTRDPEGRPTVFERLPAELPRVVTVGRLDINTEGLLLLTNDGGLARVLELPATGWLRRYRVRAHGTLTEEQLAAIRGGVTVDGIRYGPLEASIDRVQGANLWLTLALREGKNREVKNILRHLGLSVTRLIRISYGPFQLGEMEVGAVAEIRGRVLRDQLGPRLIAEAGANFEAPLRGPSVEEAEPADRKGGKTRGPRQGAGQSGNSAGQTGQTAGRDEGRETPRPAARPGARKPRPQSAGDMLEKGRQRRPRQGDGNADRRR